MTVNRVFRKELNVLLCFLEFLGSGGCWGRVLPKARRWTAMWCRRVPQDWCRGWVILEGDKWDTTSWFIALWSPKPLKKGRHVAVSCVTQEVWSQQWFCLLHQDHTVHNVVLYLMGYMTWHAVLCLCDYSKRMPRKRKTLPWWTEWKSNNWKYY